VGYSRASHAHAPDASNHCRPPGAASDVGGQRCRRTPGGAAGAASTIVNTPAQTDNSAMVAKLDELISLMKAGVKVDMDKMSFASGMSGVAR
jgi:hypothetical protein